MQIKTNSHPLEQLNFQRQTIPKVDKGADQLGFSYTGCEIKRVQWVWKTLRQFPTKLNMDIPKSPHSDVYIFSQEKWKQIHPQKITFTEMFIEALFHIAENWKQFKDSSSGKWINRLRCSPAKKYWWAMRRNRKHRCNNVAGSQRHRGDKWTWSQNVQPLCNKGTVIANQWLLGAVGGGIEWQERSRK